MVIRKSQASPIRANERSTIWDYPTPTEETGISYQNLNGRLPEKGLYKNTKCREIFFIVSGTARLTIDGVSEKVGEGDIVILEPGQSHYGEYENVSMITISTPNWTEEQCEIVD